MLRNDAALFAAYCRELLKRGALEMPDYIGFRSHISAAHTAEDIDRALPAARESVAGALDHTARTSER